MKKLILLITLIALSACRPTQKDPRTIVGMDEEFVSYVDMYQSIKGYDLYYDIPIQFADLEGSKVGLCRKWTTGQREILIDRDYWFNADTAERQRVSLIFHELGHCDLNRDHSPSLDSIMYMYNLGSENFFELFNPVMTEISSKSMQPDDCVVDMDSGTTSESNNRY